MAMDDISSALDQGAMPDEVDSPVKFRFPLLLRRAWYGLNQAFRRRIVHLGITPDQYGLAKFVRKTHGWPDAKGSYPENVQRPQYSGFLVGTYGECWIAHT